MILQMEKEGYEWCAESRHDKRVYAFINPPLSPFARGTIYKRLQALIVFFGDGFQIRSGMTKGTAGCPVRLPHPPEADSQWADVQGGNIPLSFDRLRMSGQISNRGMNGRQRLILVLACIQRDARKDRWAIVPGLFFKSSSILIFKEDDR